MVVFFTKSNNYSIQGISTGVAIRGSSWIDKSSAIWAFRKIGCSHTCNSRSVFSIHYIVILFNRFFSGTRKPSGNYSCRRRVLFFGNIDLHGLPFCQILCWNRSFSDLGFPLFWFLLWFFGLWSFLTGSWFLGFIKIGFAFYQVIIRILRTFRFS